MATVGNLFINVKARTASFNKKMRSVRATVSKLALGLINVAKKAALFGAAMGALAFGAIVVMTKKGLAAVDALAKLAANIGSTVAAIQVLQHMATLGGVSIEKMDKSIAKMVKNIGESAIGIGTATDALKELNLDAKQLEQLSPDQMFGILSDAINQLPTAARKATVAYDIFGRAGQELLVTMAGGSQAIDEMREKMEDLGVLIGDDQARMVEQANDAWTDIGLVWSGLSKQLAVNFAPVLIEIANRIKNMIIEFGGMSQVAEFIVRAFFMAGAGIMDMIKMITVGWLGLKAAVVQVAGDIASALGKVFGGDLEWIGKALQDEASDIAGVINDKLAEGWDTSQVDQYIRNLREKWDKGMPSPMAGDFAADMAPTADTKDTQDTKKGPKQKTIQSVLGSFKLGGDVGQVVQEQQLDKMSDIEIAINKMHESIDKFERERQEHLDSIKDSLAPLDSDAFIGQAPDGAVDWNEVAEKLVHATDMVPASGQIYEEVEAFPETFNMDAWEPVDTPVDPITIDDQIWMEPTIADSTKIEEDILGVEEDSLRVSKDILLTLKKGSGALT